MEYLQNLFLPVEVLFGVNDLDLVVLDGLFFLGLLSLFQLGLVYPHLLLSLNSRVLNKVLEQLVCPQGLQVDHFFCDFWQSGLEQVLWQTVVPNHLSEFAQVIYIYRLHKVRNNRVQQVGLPQITFVNQVSSRSMFSAAQYVFFSCISPFVEGVFDDVSESHVLIGFFRFDEQVY